VIKLPEVAQLVDNQIIGTFLRQKNDFVIEVQVLVRTATPPPCPLIANKYFVVLKLVEAIENLDLLDNQ